MVDLDVQYASDEPQLPNTDMLAQWANAVLLYQEKIDLSEPISNEISSSNSVLRNLDKWEKPFSMTIRIVDEPEASQLNAKWRQGNGPTNILSFPFEPPPGIEISLLGDIVICAPLVTHEASEQHKARWAHWAHLVVHGTLHLFGYDHVAKSPAQIMENIEVGILHKLGYPNPYLQKSL